MEYFSSKEKGTNYWQSTSPQAQNLTDDPFANFSEMMTLDGYAGWSNSPTATEQLLPSYGFSTPPSLPPNYGSYEKMSFLEPSNAVYPIRDSGSCLDVLVTTCGFDKTVFPHSDAQFGLPISCSDENGSSVSNQDNMSLLLQGASPRPLGRSLPERMLRALSLFKESSRGGILAQVWVPVRNGETYVLSTCEQPYLLDQMLLGYREVSRLYTFPVEHKPGSFPGLPGRVFSSKIPEWTSDVSYYSSAEYLRVNHAGDHQVHGSIAIPIFSSIDMSCCAVLELVTVKEKPNFDAEMEYVCHALKAVDLRTPALPRLLPQHLSPDRRTALAEITDVLRAVCHAHRLPLALTWIPCILEEDGVKILGIPATDCNSKQVLCIEETACYVNDKEMQGFVHACIGHPLKEGQGVAGRALQSNVPSFSTDVKSYHVNEYPLVQHARKFNLNAAVAIRLRSTYTGHDNYILELFLPLNIKRTKEQQQLLDSLSGTMQRICRSLRTVDNTEMDGSVNSKVEEYTVSHSFCSADVPMMRSQPSVARSELNEFEQISLGNPITNNQSIEADDSSVQASVSRCETEKKRNTAEKTVSLSVLRQYFSGSLKDAAKSIGVCPTTLKRICRQYGISRWPSRKINKVNRSLRKIQTVLDSVEGVEGQFKFDPTTGEIVASRSVIQEFDSCKRPLSPDKTIPTKTSTATTQDKAFPSCCLNAEVSAVKQERDSCITKNHLKAGLGFLGSMNGEEEQKSDISNSLHTTNCNILPRKFTVDAKGQMNVRGMLFEQNRPCATGMTDSSNGSGSLSSAPGSLSSAPDNSDILKQSTAKTSPEDGGSIITVKATYKEDTTRFKFDPSSGYLHLYEEVASRFKIQLGTFQLKYLDDEEEWVMLVSDSDLLECLEIMESVGKRSVKFLVRDIPCSMGSSSSSNCLLSGCS